MTPDVIAVVGTDRHPFDRLVDWLDRWVADGHGTAWIQYGTSRRPRVAEGEALRPYEDLTRMLERARLVVCHGGPATIADVRAHGHLPLCLPRDPRLGEHVDDHQQRFARRMAERGEIVLVAGEDHLRELLTTGLATPERFRVDPTHDADELAGAITTFATLAAEATRTNDRRRARWLRRPDGSRS